MIKKIILLILLLFGNMLADSGKGGQLLSFLQYGIGVRALGMGKAFTSIANDPTGMFWNPAGIARPAVQSWQLSFGYDQLFYDDTKLSYFSFVYPNRKFGTVGFIFSSIDFGSFNGRDVNDLPTGNFKSSQGLFGLSYSYYLGSFGFIRNLSTGTLFKFLKNSIGDVNNSVFDMDLGLKWRISYLKKATFGFAYQNILKAKSNQDQLFSALVFGINYNVLKNLILAADFYSPSEGEKDIRFGAEYRLELIKNFPLYFRAGYSNDEIVFGASFNIGLPSSYATKIDYAFANQSNLSTTSSKFALSLFGKSEPCDVRLHNMLGDLTAINKLSFKKFILDKFSRKADDLSSMADICADGIYGPLASVILGNLYFYKEEYNAALENFIIGYNGLKNFGDFSDVFAKHDELPMSDINLFVTYESHCNMAETYLNLKKYDSGITYMDNFKTVSTYINPATINKPKTKYKYRLIYDIALMKFSLKKYNEALADFNIITSAPKNEVDKDIFNLSAYYKGICYFNLNDLDNAINSFNVIDEISSDNSGVLQDYPAIEPYIIKDNLLVDNKYFWLAKTFDKKGNTQEAKRYAILLIYNYPYSEYFNDAINFIQ